MVFLDVDQPGDTLMEGSFLHTQIEGRELFYEVNTKSKRLSIWLPKEIEKNDGIETNDLGPTERLDPLPKPVNVSAERVVLEEPGHVDHELFPSLSVDHQGRTLLAREVSGWEICGERALVLNIKGSWYWRDVQTGRVERLPQEMNGMTPIHCSPYGQDIFLKKMARGGIFLYQLREGRLIQIAQWGLNLTWSSDGRKVVMVWTGSSRSLDEQFMFEQPWVHFPEGFGYHPILLSSTQLPFELLRVIAEQDRNRFQWLPGDRYLLGQNCSPSDDLNPTRDNHERFVSPVGLWDTEEEGKSLNGCKDWPVFDLADWENTLLFYDEIFPLHDGIVISGSDLEVRQKHYYCKEWRSCTVLWNGTYYKKLVQNGMELWSRSDNRIGKVDWETGKIVCSVEADSKARFLDGRLLRTQGDEVWLEKADCR
ncbi:MAG: hypothetical protein HQL07_19730 [Nitrospirae bacterium]|nr:hypothetical protein [Magnetococcales bacterium]